MWPRKMATLYLCIIYTLLFFLFFPFRYSEILRNHFIWIYCIGLSDKFVLVFFCFFTFFHNPYFSSTISPNQSIYILLHRPGFLGGQCRWQFRNGWLLTRRNHRATFSTLPCCWTKRLADCWRVTEEGDNLKENTTGAIEVLNRTLE